MMLLRAIKVCSKQCVLKMLFRAIKVRLTHMEYRATII